MIEKFVEKISIKGLKYQVRGEYNMEQTKESRLPGVASFFVYRNKNVLEKRRFTE